MLALGLPLAGSHLAQFLLAVTDTIMLGWYGVLDLAAGVIGAALFFTVFIFGTGFANAVMPMVATAAASDDDTEVRRSTRMGLWLSIAFGIGVLPFFWFSGAFLTLVRQPVDVVPLAETYLRIIGFSLVPALAVMVLKNYLAALGRTQIALLLTLGAVVLNIGLNWVLIFGNLGAPELGCAGRRWRPSGCSLPQFWGWRCIVQCCHLCGAMRCFNASGGRIGWRWALCGGWAGPSGWHWLRKLRCFRQQR